MLDALRERGVHRTDPVRFRLIESLARRAATQAGATQGVLNDKVAELLRSINDGAPVPPTVAPGGGASALAQLLEHLAQHKSAMAQDMSAQGQTPLPGHGSPADDPKMLQFFRRTWSRLSADQRLAQSQSSLPDNAGPLNSQHLVHRSLALMRELSPDYFDRFISHVDALLWLERTQEHAAKEVGLTPRGTSLKKGAGGRRGGGQAG
jgi:hypothetical protein